MKFSHIEELEEFFSNNSTEDILDTVEGLNRHTILNIKRLVDYNHKLKEGLKDAEEIQRSIKWSAAFVALGAILTFATSWWYRSEICDGLAHIIKHKKWLVPLIPTYLYIATANVYDYFKNYEWIADLQISQADESFDDALLDVFEAAQNDENDNNE